MYVPPLHFSKFLHSFALCSQLRLHSAAATGNAGLVTYPYPTYISRFCMSHLYFASAFTYQRFWLGREARYGRRRQHTHSYVLSVCFQNKTCPSLRTHIIIITRFETNSANKAGTPGSNFSPASA